MNEVGNLKRKIRRIEAKFRERDADAEVYEMMAHDLAGPAVIAHITRKFPEIAARWAAYKQEPASGKPPAEDAAGSGDATPCAAAPDISQETCSQMYCESCDRYEDDQIALECETCLRCGGLLAAPDDEDGQPDERQEWHDFDPDC